MVRFFAEYLTFSDVSIVRDEMSVMNIHFTHFSASLHPLWPQVAVCKMFTRGFGNDNQEFA